MCVFYLRDIPRPGRFWGGGGGAHSELAGTHPQGLALLPDRLQGGQVNETMLGLKAVLHGEPDRMGFKLVRCGRLEVLSFPSRPRDSAIKPMTAAAG